MNPRVFGEVDVEAHISRGDDNEVVGALRDVARKLCSHGVCPQHNMTLCLSVIEQRVMLNQLSV